ncbi:MAG: hypothetical protein J5720_02995 [Bacteroidaceae bacterium]|nr:hypothetical protein [Bacteroidaceae bacterium]
MTILNHIIPFGTYKAINLFGIIFTKMPLQPSEVNHEMIHTRQLLEMAVFGFYLWYLVEWGIRFLKLRNMKQAYYNISFEREAYANEANLNYLKTRKLFASFKYL